VTTITVVQALAAIIVVVVWRERRDTNE
jgi:hypothetical protein